jgi:hypothetical protein
VPYECNAQGIDFVFIEIRYFNSFAELNLNTSDARLSMCQCTSRLSQALTMYTKVKQDLKQVACESDSLFSADG